MPRKRHSIGRAVRFVRSRPTDGYPVLHNVRRVVQALSLVASWVDPEVVASWDAARRLEAYEWAVRERLVRDGSTQPRLPTPAHVADAAILD